MKDRLHQTLLKFDFRLGIYVFLFECSKFGISLYTRIMYKLLESYIFYRRKHESDRLYIKFSTVYQYTVVLMFNIFDYRPRRPQNGHCRSY